MPGRKRIIINPSEDSEGDFSEPGSPIPRNGASGCRVGVETMLRKFLKDESGATAIEYSLIAAGISIAIVAVVQTVGTNLTSTFTSIGAAVR